MQADERYDPELDESAVVEFLRSNPDFFERHPALLSDLNLPHASGRAVSLVEAQVNILRERNMDMRRRLNALLQAARDNDALFAKTRALALALLQADSLQALNEVLATHVLVDFEADFVCAHLPGTGRAHDHMRYHAGELPTASWTASGSAHCTTLRGNELERLFPLADITEQDDSGSAVILALTLPQGTGALCIGSRNAHHFSSDMDTLFVTFIADVLARVLNRLEP